MKVLCYTAVVLLLTCHVLCDTTVDIWLTTTDKSKLLQPQSAIHFNSEPPTSPDASITIAVDPSRVYQTITGFGAAMTGSSADVLSKFYKRNSTAGELLMKILFSPPSLKSRPTPLFAGDTMPGVPIGISMMRVPVGACDFSLGDYTFDDVNPSNPDWNMNSFSISRDGSNGVADMLKKARDTAPHDELTLLATPWTPPVWLKSTHQWGSGSLWLTSDSNHNDQVYTAYSRYFLDYVYDYKNSHGIDFKYITLQNEPRFAPGSYPGMLMASDNQATFGGKLIDTKNSNSKYSNLNFKMLAYDHNWDDITYPIDVLSSSDGKHFSGSAFHCYAGSVSAQTTVHDKFPDKELHLTECSGGYWAPDFGSNLIWNMQNLFLGGTHNWAQSVLLWNLALDNNDGPTNNGCKNCRGVLKIPDSATKVEDVNFNVEFFSIGHLSAFVRPNSHRVHVDVGNNSGNQVLAQSFLSSDKSHIILVVLNSWGDNANLQIQWNGHSTQYSLPPGVATFVWNV
eukprot:TRINITY_DN7586_c0_g1_i1.p1 TRINITY_DN7586_c0_g1~~TRINITY_DN7586_c0_g1_i1.p1  ORF type:complete len:510 (-),score=98.71 TRINITY_DN7586_c0_g1_i1:13-1542(-)